MYIFFSEINITITISVLTNGRTVYSIFVTKIQLKTQIFQTKQTKE